MTIIISTRSRLEKKLIIHINREMYITKKKHFNAVQNDLNNRLIKTISSTSSGCRALCVEEN